MKNAMKLTATLLLLVLPLLCLVACDGEDKDLWADAKYTENVTLGEGAKTVTVDVIADNKTVTFTIMTNKDTVGDALTEHGLLEGEDSQFGLYVKKVNGIEADFDKDQTYWALYINGEYAMTGVDMTEITEGAVYRLVRTK